MDYRKNMNNPRDMIDDEMLLRMIHENEPIASSYGRRNRYFGRASCGCGQNRNGTVLSDNTTCGCKHHTPCGCSGTSSELYSVNLGRGSAGKGGCGRNTGRCGEGTEGCGRNAGRCGEGTGGCGRNAGRCGENHGDCDRNTESYGGNTRDRDEKKSSCGCPASAALYDSVISDKKERTSKQECGCGDDCESCPNRERCFGIAEFPIAMAYVPWQKWERLIESEEEAMRIGTIFAEMDLPWHMSLCDKENCRRCNENR